MKKDWNSPELEELTIKATEKKGDSNADNGDTFSPDEFHPERLISGAITCTPTPLIPFKPSRPGKH